MTIEIFVQLLLDGVFLALCCVSLLGRSRGKWDYLLALVFFFVGMAARFGLGYSKDVLSYAVLPIDSIIPFIFFFLALLLINSVWFPAGEGHTFFGTIAALALYLLLRELCLAGLYLCTLREPFWYLYGGRVLSILLWCGLWAGGVLRWLREQLAEGDIPIRIVMCNTAVLLLLLLTVFQFDLSKQFHNIQVVLGVLMLAAFGNGAVILIEQRRIQTRRRTRLLEQYLPLVEELVEQVRSRQHEFNNHMMAISAALATATDLQGARDAVAAQIGHTKLDAMDRELLKCDSKVIGGMLFGKVKQAEMRHTRLEVTIAGAFLHHSVQEADWVEIIGVLVDNALEASGPEDVVYVRVTEEAQGVRFAVSNPHPALSSVEFMQMFRRGWSTKKDGSHGYGLYNIRRTVELHGGNIVTRNETISEAPYITIGVLVP